MNLKNIISRSLKEEEKENLEKSIAEIRKSLQ